MSKPELSENAFWQYSVRCYTHGDTTLHALALQDDHGVNVNMLMLLCWCLEHGVIVDLSQFEALRQAADDLAPTLSEHRAARRAAHPDHGGSERAYQAKKEAELALERQQQRAILNTFNHLSVMQLPRITGKGLLNASVAAFINCYRLRDNADARQHIRSIINQLPN